MVPYVVTCLRTATTLCIRSKGIHPGQRMDLSSELARTLLGLAPDPTVVVDTDGTVVLANTRLEELFGYRATELDGLSIETLLPAGVPASRPVPDSLLPAIFARGSRKDGQEVPVEISSIRATTATGA